MNKTEQETAFSEETIKFRPHTVYNFFGPLNRPRRLLKGWHLFPFHSYIQIFRQCRCFDIDCWLNRPINFAGTIILVSGRAAAWLVESLPYNPEAQVRYPAG